MIGIDSKAARCAWTHAAIITIVATSACVIFTIRKTLLVFAIAVMFAYFLYPVVDVIQRRFPWMSRLVALIVPFALALAALMTFVMFVKDPIRMETDHMLAQVMRPDFKQQISNWSPLNLPIGQMIVTSYDQNRILGMAPQFAKALRTFGRELSNFLIVPILSFFLLKDGRQIRNTILQVSFVEPCALESFMRDAHDLMLQYMRALFLQCLATLVCFTIALNLMNAPYATLLAAVACPLEFVPLVGPLTSAAMILAVSGLIGYPHVAWLLTFLIVYRLFQDYVLSPHLMRKGVKLHPLLVLFGIIAGGEIGGIPGIFLSVPLIALIRLVCYEASKHNSRAFSRTVVCELSSDQAIGA